MLPRDFLPLCPRRYAFLTLVFCPIESLCPIESPKKLKPWQVPRGEFEAGFFSTSLEIAQEALFVLLFIARPVAQIAAK